MPGLETTMQMVVVIRLWLVGVRAITGYDTRTLE